MLYHHMLNLTEQSPLIIAIALACIALVIYWFYSSYYLSKAIRFLATPYLLYNLYLASPMFFKSPSKMMFQDMITADVYTFMYPQYDKYFAYLSANFGLDKWYMWIFYIVLTFFWIVGRIDMPSRSIEIEKASEEVAKRMRELD